MLSVRTKHGWSFTYIDGLNLSDWAQHHSSRRPVRSDLLKVGKGHSAAVVAEDTAQIEENVDFEGSHVRHLLGCGSEFFLCHLRPSVALREVQVNLLHQFHIVQQRAEGHEVGEGHLQTPTMTNTI